MVRRLRAAEGHPGVLDEVGGTAFTLRRPPRAGLTGFAGDIIAQRDGAICRATFDGAVWITHLKLRATGRPAGFKLPATRALELAGVEVDVPETRVPVHPSLREGHTHSEISYSESGGVGYLRFDFYNGAMSTELPPPA